MSEKDPAPSADDAGLPDDAPDGGASGERANAAAAAVGHASIDEAARALATEEGRRQALRDLGVHVSGALGEKYGITDAEGSRLLEQSRALATREGRQQILRDQLGGADEHATYSLSLRGASIDERRERATELIAASKAAGITPARAGKGCLALILIALAILVLVLLGAAWLFDALTSSGVAAGGAGGSAFGQSGATRPEWAWFGAPAGSA